MLFACEKKEDFTVNLRNPHKVEFQERVLSVTPGDLRPSDLQVVDLGLSVKWADRNVGAISVDDDGDLFAWGEIAPKDYYSWKTYEHNDYHDNMTLYLTKYCYDKYGESQDIDPNSDNLILHKNDDAAYVYYGEGYRMPTVQEFSELVNDCTWSVEEKKDKGGYLYKVTGPNGNSITIPVYEFALGEKAKVNSDATGREFAGIWSASLSPQESPYGQSLHLQGENINIVQTGQNRCIGNYIRAVFVK